LNAGCPVPKVVKHGAGAALMRSPATLGAIVRQMAKASAERLGGIPVTIKMRSGWDSSSINYVECARIAAEEGAAMATLHPRTRAQGYGGRSDWPQIADLAGRLGIPVCGSGDLFAPEDAGRMLAETGCAAAMFARGALGNPFIFASAREFLETGRYEPPSFGARLGAGLRHLELLAADIGEKSACLEMRKQFCAYTRGAPGQPGMPGAAALRQKIVHAETVAQYRDILGAFLAPPLVEANA
jgi:nifR3 family TIM-barrel protein